MHPGIRAVLLLALRPFRQLDDLSDFTVPAWPIARVLHKQYTV
jgi:hypothetical protein